MKKLVNNKKGFTLIELIATVALMAIIAGIAVPSVYATTSRKQKSTAETDLQQMYRNSVSCITDLAERYITPASPYSRFNTYPNDEDDNAQTYLSDSLMTFPGYELILPQSSTADGWYIEYEKQLVKKLYATITALDIDVYYYYPQESPSTTDTSATVKSNEYPWLKIPNGCSASDRSTYVTAGNKNPYIVVQVVRIFEPDSTTKYNNFLIISYHNDKNQFSYQNSVEVSTVNGTNVPLLSGFGDDHKGYHTYTKNNGDDIIYSYRIR